MKSSRRKRDGAEALSPAPSESGNGGTAAKGGIAERLPLRDHLLELRKVILISLAAVGIAFLLSLYFFIDPLMEWIAAPIKERGVQIIYTAVSEALTTKMKVAMIAAIILASPIIIWQAWSFVRPALYPKERITVCCFFIVSLLLFLLGIVFCYVAVYYLAIDFFMVSGQGLAKPMLSLDKYVSFLFGFLPPFGIGFMLPVFIYLTTKAGWTTPEMLAGKRKFVILGIFFVAAILTPPDVVSQILLGVPLILLYEVGILVSRLVKRAEKPQTNT